MPSVPNGYCLRTSSRFEKRSRNPLARHRVCHTRAPAQNASILKPREFARDDAEPDRLSPELRATGCPRY